VTGIRGFNAGAVPPEIDKAAFAGAPALSGLSAEERHAYDHFNFFYNYGLGYAIEMHSHPQTLYGIADLPAGLAAFSTPRASPSRLP
jgi:hypothetical protein